MDQKRTAFPSARGEAEVTVESVAGAVRAAILAGEYGPNHRLIEADLCEQFGASRFIVRVALQELSSDGLVEMQRNKGARVRAVPIEEALEIVEIRQALEGLSAARAAKRASAAEVADLREIAVLMRRAVEAGELLTYSELNARLHSTIQSISANATCTRTLERLRGQVVRHQFALSLRPGRSSVSLVQHEAIVGAIADHDPEAAEAAMRHHLDSVLEALRTMPPPRIY